MELATHILSFGTQLWDLVKRHECYICELEANLSSLKTKIKDLIDKRNDVMQNVQLLEQKGMTRTNQVGSWLTSVQEKEIEVNQFLSEDGNNGSTCLKIWRCRSSYKLREKSRDLLDSLKDLISKGEFSEVATQQPPYITEREDIVNSLISEMKTLKARSDDVKQKIEVEEQKGMVRTTGVTDWLQLVDEIGQRVKEISDNNAQLSGNASTSGSAYEVWKKAKKTLDDVKHLYNRGAFPEVATYLPRIAPTRETEGLCEIPIRTQNSLGIKSNLDKVLKGLQDDKVGIIALYGMGGVGKSTLLKLINNSLVGSGDNAFNWVFWVEASRNTTIETIQEQIMGKLKIPYGDNNSVQDICNEIYNALKNKRYILMLDDVWEMFDLVEGVGLPHVHHLNKNKIIFTTRSKHVCHQMDAELIIKVECLSKEDAWSLFQKNVGNSTISSHIESCAKKVADECEGLPLALEIIGKAMTDKREPELWLSALAKLQNCPQNFDNLEKRVFHVLKLSYDFLNDEIKQKCFLYCSLFREGYSIPIYKLINLWTGESYLNGVGDITKARNYGSEIIDHLMRACLLESGSFVGSVKMHDMIRDMALMIAKDQFLYCEKAESMTAINNDRSWNNNSVEKVSLWGSQHSLYNREEASSSQREQEELTLTRECPKLSTLLCQLSPRINLSELLKYMLKVRVLDLSESTDVTHLPVVVSKLENLEYLDISKTGIRRLPKEMKSLSKLKYLLMKSMLYLEEFSADIIFGLTDLSVFRMDYSLLSPEDILRSLEEMQNIQEISICLDSDTTMNFFLSSRKLQRCATFMQLKNTSEEFELCPTKMKSLELLLINATNLKALKCSDLTKSTDIFNNLRYVEVLRCESLVELDILVYAQNLKKLEVRYCKSLQRILNMVKANSAFLSLKHMCLDDLPGLEIICNKSLSFPDLEIIEIRGCPKLQNPFDDMVLTNKNLRAIKGDRMWWDSLNWIDRRQHFSQLFTEFS